MDNRELTNGARAAVAVVEASVQAQSNVIHEQGKKLATIAVNLKRLLKSDTLSDTAKTGAVIQTLYEYSSGKITVSEISDRFEHLEKAMRSL